MKYLIGIYIKPGFIKAAMYDMRGHYLHFWEDQDSTDYEPEFVVSRIAAGVSSLLSLRNAAMDDLVGIGITLEADVDIIGGVVKEAAGLKWRQVRLREIMQLQLDKPVLIENVTNCTALAEMWQGAGWGKKDIIFVDCAAPGQMSVIRDKKLDRQYDGPDIRSELAGEEKMAAELLPVVDAVKPEIIIINGPDKAGDTEFWRNINQALLSHAGPAAPQAVPAELGTEDLTIGAAALVIFS